MVAHLDQWHLVLEAALAEEQSLSCCITNEVVRRGDVEKLTGGIAQSREPIFPLRGANEDNHA
jgi:hypothetical protein